MPRKSWIAETAASVSEAVAAPVKAIKAVAKAFVPPPPWRRDPFYTDDERKRQINERQKPRWLDRRPDWFRRWRG